MEYKATLRYLHMTPRKVRLLADLIRGKNAVRARQELQFAVKRAARPLGKLLDSAIANAKQQGINEVEALKVKTIRVDQGPKRRTFLPRAFGRVSPLDKRMSHVTLILERLSESEALQTETAPVVAKASVASESPFDSADNTPKATRPRAAKKSGAGQRRSAPTTGKRIFRRKSI